MWLWQLYFVANNIMELDYTSTTAVVLKLLKIDS